MGCWRETMHEIMKKVQNNIAVQCSNYYVDRKTEKAETIAVPHFNTTMLYLSCILNENVLLCGEPGFGKTTDARLVASISTSLPYDLYDSCKIKGHPEQTEEKTQARLDFGELPLGRETVIWQIAWFLDVIIMDEFKRFPKGKQETFMDAMDTGWSTYLNDSVYFGKRPFFATANHGDDGLATMDEAIRDRFAISLEMGYAGALSAERIVRARDNVRRDLCNNGMTAAIRAALQDKKKSKDGKRQSLDKMADEFSTQLRAAGFERVTAAERDALRASILSMHLEPEARVFYNCIDSELNSSPTYGVKRSCDPPEESTHAKKLAVSKTRNGLSPRGTAAILEYAQAIALFLGSKKVQKGHIMAVAPYVLGHRLQFTDTYKGETSNKGRLQGEMEGTDCSRRLLLDIDANYQQAVMPSFELIYTAVTRPQELTKQQLAEFEELKQNRTKIDHPFIREVLEAITNG
ncbi:hypothetical protein HY639_04510 [Candidatus Woesearchaeota archaeon]|nr:hypothetical protein [Candidatus Woesearchaeota archaeon]